MTSFNLAVDPWIPVRWRDSSDPRRRVSLMEVFELGDQIADLSCAPHERISLMRLLVCIAQAAAGAPEHPRSWDRWTPDLASQATQYLNQWKDRFELFGTGPRFLQVELPASEEPVPSSKLWFHLASGNNPTVLDHFGGTTRAMDVSQLGLGLLTFQCFYPLYGAGFKGKGPCVDSNMVHLVLVGEHLLDSIRLNCLDLKTVAAHFKDFGRPSWEASDPGITSYLGRLVPRHRNLQLRENATGFDLTKGSWQYPVFESVIEPSATVIVRKKSGTEQRGLLSGNLHRALWRDLHAVVVLREAEADQRRAPLVLQSHWMQFGRGAARLWLGAVITDFKAKVHDITESFFIVPPDLFQEGGQLRYEQGVAFADKVASRLSKAVAAFATALKQKTDHSAAHRHFWNHLDRDHPVLLRLLEGIFTDRDPMLGRTFGERGPDGEFDSWTTLVHQAAREAYDRVCPRLTPRQLQAYAGGLRILFPHSNSSKRTTHHA